MGNGIRGLLFLLCLAVTSGTGAAVGSSPRGSDVVEVRYGHIVGKRVVEEKNSVPTGAILGGLVGLATAGGKSSGTKAKRAAGGAILGGVLANQVDKSQRLWLYTIRFPGGGEERIAIEDDRLALGDCAAVEYGEYETRVHYSSEYFCRPEAETYEVRGANDAPPGLEVVDDDDPCREAKRRLLDATDPEEIDLLAEKVRLICGTGG